LRFVGSPLGRVCEARVPFPGAGLLLSSAGAIRSPSFLERGFGPLLDGFPIAIFIALSFLGDFLSFQRKELRFLLGPGLVIEGFYGVVM